jgi:hypothetical protein
MKDTVFFRQAALLLRILPLIHREEEKHFLVSVKESAPRWDLLGLEGVERTRQSVV